VTGALPKQLQTPRLVLREPRHSDAHHLFAGYLQDPEVTRYMVWRPYTALGEAQSFIAQCIDAWRNGDRLPYVLELSETEPNPVGMLEARIRGSTIDFGYVLARPHWGKGLMPEAIAAFSDKVLAEPAFFRIQATCDVDNKASARVLEKCGFVREGRLARYTLHPNISPEPRDCWMYAKVRG
jgi:[ribosomal protein S5]-alanine N-acetyltransferase